MTPFIRWVLAARWHRSVSHCVEGLLVQVPVTLVTRNPWFGAASVLIWYWSRKKLEVEFERKGKRSTALVWKQGWFPWEWGWARVLDVLIPTVTSFLLAWLWVVAGWPWY
ncbi:hypothetical protein [Burkholderia sp. PAMC 26561]|uniref:hypothetical protein n=1 Tax=Burkholderia sp. PAMC 26561 TaxID=1795043 RepID=UPI000782371D|nr:hypothetical protein [Burkholderia sp. PAMC 26561]